MSFINWIRFILKISIVNKKRITFVNWHLLLKSCFLFFFLWFFHVLTIRYWFTLFWAICFHSFSFFDRSFLKTNILTSFIWNFRLNSFEFKEMTQRNLLYFVFLFIFNDFFYWLINELIWFFIWANFRIIIKCFFTNDIFFLFFLIEIFCCFLNRLFKNKFLISFNAIKRVV